MVFSYFLTEIQQFLQERLKTLLPDFPVTVIRPGVLQEFNRALVVSVQSVDPEIRLIGDFLLNKPMPVVLIGDLDYGITSLRLSASMKFPPMLMFMHLSSERLTILPLLYIALRNYPTTPLDSTTAKLEIQLEDPSLQEIIDLPYSLLFTVLPSPEHVSMTDATSAVLHYKSYAPRYVDVFFYQPDSAYFISLEEQFPAKENDAVAKWITLKPFGFSLFLENPYGRDVKYNNVYVLETVDLWWTKHPRFFFCPTYAYPVEVVLSFQARFPSREELDAYSPIIFNLIAFDLQKHLRSKYSTAFYNLAMSSSDAGEEMGPSGRTFYVVEITANMPITLEETYPPALDFRLPPSDRLKIVFENVEEEIIDSVVKKVERFRGEWLEKPFLYSDLFYSSTEALPEFPIELPYFTQE